MTSFFKQILRKVCTDNIFTSSIPLQIPKITVQELIWKDLDKWSDRIAIQSFETQRGYTYHQLYKKSLSVTRFLRNFLNFERQITVAIVLPNIPEYPIIALGAVQAGLKVSGCTPIYTSGEIRRQLINSEARVIFTSTELLAKIHQTGVKIPIVEVSSNGTTSKGCVSFDEIVSKEGDRSIDGARLDEVVFLPYSSGTTGLPKGVLLTHYNIVANLTQFTQDKFCIIANDAHQYIVTAFLPFGHIYGFVVILLQSLIRGAKMVTMTHFTSERFIHLLENYKVDVIFGVPPTVQLINNTLKKEIICNVKTVACGAAPLYPKDINRFFEKTENKTNLIQGFGMTETSGVAILQSVLLGNGYKIETVGILLPLTEAKIVAIEGSNFDALPINKRGEILLKGPQMTSGYLNNPEANKNGFVDGWLRTGDVGFFDEDEHFHLTGRIKELIKVKGFHVAPAEIEAILREHSKVEDAAVIGIPDEILGEAPKAIVVAKRVKPEELMKFVEMKLSEPKHLVGGVVFVDAIPRSATGKILRNELRKMSFMEIK